MRDILEGVVSSAAGRERQRKVADQRGSYGDVGGGPRLSAPALAREIITLEQKMYEHARNLEFEEAAKARDALARLRARELMGVATG